MARRRRGNERLWANVTMVLDSGLRHLGAKLPQLWWRRVVGNAVVEEVDCSG